MALVHGLHNAPIPNSINQIVSTSQILKASTDLYRYLSDSKAAPFLLPEQFQSSFGSIEIFLGDLLEHVLGQLHVSVLVLVVGIPGNLTN